jgi:uncharacterized protein (DUF58 family)
MSLTPEILARIDRLELDAKQVVEGFLAGRHKSPRHGFAVEFAQHREYTPGDDIKHIDWKVFARTERYHLKQYEQETNLVVWMLVDASESMMVGTVKRKDGTVVTKYDAACTLAAALAYLIVNQADCVGLQLYADRVRAMLKPGGGMGRVRELVRTVAEGPFKGMADTGRALTELGGLLGRRGVVFVFSDLLDDVEPLVSGLRILRSQKHEVVVFQVLDAAELDFSFRQPTLFQGLEELPEVSTDPLSVRDQYLTALNAHLTEIETMCRTQEIDFTRVRTDQDLGLALAEYLQKRRGR